MNNYQRRSEIDDIERALSRADPTLPRRMRALERADTLNVFVVFSLLATGAMLLTAGLATFSLGLWSAGGAALVISVLVDRWHQRRLRRARELPRLTSVQSPSGPRGNS